MFYISIDIFTLTNAGRSFPKPSFVVSGLGFSSLLINVVVPFLPGTETDTISWSKNPNIDWNNTNIVF